MRSLTSVALVMVAAAAAADQPDAKIEALAATARGGRISVSFRLEGAFRNGEMVEALQSGLPTSLSYRIEVVRHRPQWFDSHVASVRIDVICTFNSVTREYLLNYRRDRHLVRSESFTDPAALRQRMTTIEEVDLFEIGDRKPYKLVVRARAGLTRGWLMYVIPWEVSTGWREARVRVAER